MRSKEGRISPLVTVCLLSAASLAAAASTLQPEAPTETRPRVERTGDRLEVQLARQVNLCTHVFVDAGANIGMHARFLFEPAAYPNSSFVSVFDRIFGRSRDNSRICAVEFEPNPEHRPRYAALVRAYAAQGWRVIYAPYALGDGVSESVTFYRNSAANSSNEGWGFGMINHAGRHFAAARDAERIEVPSIDMSAFLQHLGERQPGAGDTPADLRTVVKMDIEGAEFFTLPHLIRTGAICTLDFLSAEFHGFLAEHRSISFPDHHLHIADQPAALALRAQIEQAVADGPPECRTHQIEDIDDESYLRDRSPSQLSDPRPDVP